MSNIRTNFFISIAYTNATVLIGFVASLFIARLLTPNQIGIFSVAFVFAGLLRNIREMGLGAYIVQEKELTPARFQTAFGISIAISLVTGLIVAALAETAGRFYREPGITQVLYIIAIGFLIVPIGATSRSILTREMRFKEIAVVEIVAALVQSGTAVVLAWRGYGYVSLAWASIAGIAASVAVVVFYRPANLPWLPSFSEWRHVFRFTRYQSGSSLILYANESTGDLILGRMLNMTSVALFNRALSLSNLFTPIVMRAVQAVSLPHFAQQNREGHSAAPGFLHATSLVAIISAPLFAVMAITAEPLILVLFGPQWTESVPILRILCLAGLAGSFEGLVRPVLTAIGQVREQLNLDVKVLALNVIGIIGAAFFGLAAVAWVFFATRVFSAILRQRILNNEIGIGWPQLLAATRYVVRPTVLSVLGPAFIVYFFDQLPPYAILGLCAVTATLGWLIALATTSNPLWVEIKNVISHIHRNKNS